MTTVANINAKPKKPTEAVNRLAREFGFKVRLCRTQAFDCLVNDLMAYSKSECILSDEGFNTLKEKYNSELNEFIDEMGRQYELEKAETGNLDDSTNLMSIDLVHAKYIICFCISTILINPGCSSL